MDPHVRWLRRFVLGRALARAVVESTVVGVSVMVASVVVGIDRPLATVISLLGAQGFLAVRLGTALAFNPINRRYLMGWDDLTHLLHPAAPDRRFDPIELIETGDRADHEPVEGDRLSLDTELRTMGLHHLVRLQRIDYADGDPTGGDERPGGRCEPDQGYEVYASPSRLVLAVVGADGQELTVLSRLADGRLLVTTTELVPPRVDAMVNLTAAISMPDMVLSHIQLLDSLRHGGTGAVRVGYEAVILQLRLEWQSWNQLGPFVGPLLAVDPRPQPHLLQIRLPHNGPWRRSSPPAEGRPEVIGSVRSSEPTPVV